MKPRIKTPRLTVVEGRKQESEFESITLAEQAYRAIRKNIVSGALEAGSSLKLEFLKERYGISFSPIREALNRLQSERLVVSTPSRGFKVSPFSEEEMWDAISTHILIDSEALRRTLARAGDTWEAELVGSFHALNLALAQQQEDNCDLDENEELLEARHRDFHHCLISACGSRWLLELSGSLYSQTERYRRPNLRGSRGLYNKRDVGAEHQDLIDAAIARDADLACALLAKHYRETGNNIVAAISARESRDITPT